MSFPYALHVLSAVIWVGGMFFAYQVLRPIAAANLDAPVRLRLWLDVFGRFFPWVKLAVVLLFLTGFWIIYLPGGMGAARWHVHAMLTLALVMTGIFGYLNHAALKALRAGVESQDWPAGGTALGTIRRLVGINLILGLITVAVASGGRFV